jgi:4-amino-4-deoxy-L-arabinose transferase
LFSLIAIIIAQLIKEYGLNKAHSYIIILYAVSLTVSGLISVIIPSGFTTPCSVTFLALCLGIVIYITYRANKTGNNSGLIYIAFAASVFLLVSTGSMISENQIQINSTQPLSDFIKEHKLEAREILVYNRRLPSLSFHLQKPIVSLYDGNPGLKREVQFEENKMWKENLVNLQDNNELMKLKERLDNMGSVLIVYKNRLPDNRKWLLKYYVNKKDMNKWQIYY